MHSIRAAASDGTLSPKILARFAVWISFKPPDYPVAHCLEAPAFRIPGDVALFT